MWTDVFLYGRGNGLENYLFVSEDKEAVSSDAAHFGGTIPTPHVYMPRQKDAPNVRQQKRKGLYMNIRFMELLSLWPKIRIIIMTKRFFHGKCRWRVGGKRGCADTGFFQPSRLRLRLPGRRERQGGTMMVSVKLSIWHDIILLFFLDTFTFM